jgi:hypothetical protein
MASIGYEYEPEDDEIEPSTGNVYNDDELCLSTKLEELDYYDALNKHSDDINRVLMDTMSPNILEKPFEAKTIPEGGVYSKEPRKEQQVVSELIDERKKDISTLTKEENEQIIEKFEKSKLSNMSLNEFIKFLADSYLDIINDFLEIKSIDDIPNIFVKNDRLIAIGVLLLAISIFFIFFNQL